MTLDELATLVRLFGDRVRIGPGGEVTIEREPPRQYAVDTKKGRTTKWTNR